MATNQGAFHGKNQASPLLNSSNSSRKLFTSEKSSLSGSFESPKSYGSTTNPVRSEADTKLVGHVVDIDDTLQGLSIRYGVPVEEIKRVNKLWTNDNIHIHKIIKIPIKTNSKFADIDDVEVECENESEHNEVVPDVVEIGDKAKGDDVASNGAQTTGTTDSMSSFLQQIDKNIKQSVKQSEKLRSQPSKALIEALERDTPRNNSRQNDLFRPLSTSSRQSEGPRLARFVTRGASSDFVNSDDQFFEL